MSEDASAITGQVIGAKKQMSSLNIESQPDRDKIAFLARLANTLTICARDSYEAGTERVLEPEVLRAYNELLHRVTGVVRDRLSGHEGYSL